MENDKALHPVHVGALSADAVVLDADQRAHLLKQLRGLVGHDVFPQNFRTPNPDKCTLPRAKYVDQTGIRRHACTTTTSQAALT